MKGRSALLLALALTWAGWSEAFSWEEVWPYLERAETVYVVAPVMRERPLMEAVWKRGKESRGRTVLIASPQAEYDPASYWAALALLGIELRVVDPFPLKPEGSFVVTDGKLGVIGPLVAGLGDLEGKTRKLSPEEVGKWWGYALTLYRASKPSERDPQKELLLRLLKEVVR